MKVAKSSRKDLEELTEFFDRVTCHLETYVNYPKWTRGVYPGRKSIEQAISDGVQYMCVEEERIVGAFILNQDPGGDYDCGAWSRSLAPEAYYVIHTLATDPEIFHKGVGKFMINWCVRTARERGAKAIRLDVVPDNTPARGLYEVMGFSFAGEKDLKRGIPEIPVFALYEKNLD